MNKREMMVCLTNILFLLEATQKGLIASGFTEDAKLLEVQINEVKAILSSLETEPEDRFWETLLKRTIVLVEIMHLITFFASIIK